MRWQHPERGLIAPADFIPVAEESGLIVAAGQWALHTACRQAKVWQDAGLPALTMAVNISARQFQAGNLPMLVAAVLKEAGISPETLELEITENVVMESAERTIATLREFKQIGVQLSVDDFGTGYSSLSYLKRFPLGKLKVDQSFVRNLSTDVKDAAIVGSVIELGHSLGLKVIAEGVETAAQLDFLRQHRCEAAQGYLFGAPVPADTLGERLKSVA